MIQEVHVFSSTQNDLLQAPSRLAAIPFNGTLTLEISAQVCSSTNHVDLTLQLPEGEVPVDAQIVPENGYDNANWMLHSDTMLVFQFDATQGGHFLISVVETGSCPYIVRATLIAPG